MTLLYPRCSTTALQMFSYNTLDIGRCAPTRPQLHVNTTHKPRWPCTSDPLDARNIKADEEMYCFQGPAAAPEHLLNLLHWACELDPGRLEMKTNQCAHLEIIGSCGRTTASW